jgi:SAM-dependent methyltransferase
MSLWYKLLYQLGVTPWEEDATRGSVAEQFCALFDREENERQPPYGQVLDLGCGSGIWSVTLAARGWQVTGVDIVPKAIRTACERAQAAGVEVRFVQGDVTALRAAGVESSFRFVVDFECFNHLNDAQRKAVGREVSAVAAPDATMLILAWAPGRRWPLPPGASRGDIETALPGWKVVDEEAYAAQSALPWWLKNTELGFYRLRRGLPDRASGGGNALALTGF